MAQSGKIKKIEYATLLSVLANGSTAEARKLLKRHTGEDAMNVKDLEVKLAKLYAQSTNKFDLEKEFVQIHPHKEFIVKYTQPKVELSAKSDLQEELGDASRLEKERQQDIINRMEIVLEDWSAKNKTDFSNQQCGNPNCPYCRQFLNTEQSSNFSAPQMTGFANPQITGYPNPQKEQKSELTGGIVVLGVIGVIGVIALAYAYNKK